MHNAKETSRKPVEPELRRLAFLDSFMAMQGLTITEMARILGFSVPACRHQLNVVDDIKLSYAEELIEHFGYKLNVFLTRERPEDIGTDKVSINVEDYVLMPGEQYVPNRLAFLDIAMKRYGITKTMLANLMNVNVTSVRHFFISQDIYWSRLIQIARVCDFSIHVSIRPMVSENEKLKNAEGKRFYITEIENKKIIEL